MLRYMKALATIILKNPLLWVVTLLCAGVVALPAIKGDGIFPGNYLNRETFARDQLDAMRSNLDSAERDGVPEEIQDEWRDQISLMTRAVTAKTEREYFEIRAEMAERDAARTRAGTLVGSTAEELDSQTLFFERMAALPDPVLYETCAEASATWYLSYESGGQPLILWMLPALVAAASAVDAMRGKRLLAQAPVALSPRFAAQLVLLVALSLILLFAICLPSFALQSIRVGMGDLGYPVVQLMAGTQFDETVGSVLLRELAAYGAISLLIASMSLAGACVLRNRGAYAGVILAGALCAAPLISAYMQMGSVSYYAATEPAPVDPLASYSVLAYLDVIVRAAGQADYWPMQDALQDSRLSFEGGLMVLTGWAAVAILIGVLALAVRYLLSKRGMRTVAERDVQSGLFDAIGLTLGYGRSTLLRDSSFMLHPGEIVGLIAPNGCGKTTLLETLTGLNGARRSGAVAADGVPLTHTAAFRSQVLYVPCEAALLYPNLTAADHIRIAASLWPDKVDTGKLIAFCQLEGYLNRPVRTYSSGMKQQLALAVAYCTGVRYLLLDEPMNALDPGNVALNSRILKRLAAQRRGVLFSSHILSNVDELCGSVITIQEGNLIRHPVGKDGATARAVYDAAFSTR